MGTDTASSQSSSSPIAIFWLERPVKYSFPGGHLVVEEVKTPWDLYVEGRYFGSPVGDTFHQALVKHGLERVFSIRDSTHGNPICDIITKPQDAPAYPMPWGARRVFKTSHPMTIDGQKLVVMDVVGPEGKRSADPILNLAKDFFQSQGGVLRGENPNSLIYSDKRDIKRWRKILDLEIVLDIMISSKPIQKAIPRLTPDTVFATNAEVAIELLATRNWYRCHINADEPWTDRVVDHMDKFPDDQPHVVSVYGTSKRFKEFFARVDEIYSRPLPEKEKK